MQDLNRNYSRSLSPKHKYKRKFSNKYEWPEVVGKEGFIAEQIIKSQNEQLQTQVIEQGIAIQPDYQVQRVRILLNEQGKVKQIPRIG